MLNTSPMGPPLEVSKRRRESFIDRLTRDHELRLFLALVVAVLGMLAGGIVGGIQYDKLQKAETVLKGIANDDYPAVIMERANDDRWAKHYAMSYFDPTWTDLKGRKYNQ